MYVRLVIVYELLAIMVFVSGCSNKPVSITPRTPPIALPPGYSVSVPGGEVLSHEMGKVVESGSINCGLVNPWGRKRRASEACAVAALRSKKPFLLRYQFGGVNHEIKNQGLVGTSKGQVYFFSNVEYASENNVAFQPPYLCKHPIIVSLHGRQRIACKDKPNLIN